MRTKPEKANLLAIVLLSALVLLAGGAAHRWSDTFLATRDSIPAVLERPLSSLPLQLGSWHGVDVPLRDGVLDIAKNDDYVNRRYLNKESTHTVGLYIGYTVQPDNMLGHRPRVCYPAHGWTNKETSRSRIVLSNGTELDCLIHEFERRQPVYQGVVVLNYYILQGRHTCDWGNLWQRKRRLPRRSRDAGLYVAQAQISSTFTDRSSVGISGEVVEQFAAQVAPEVTKLLPDTQTAGQQ